VGASVLASRTFDLALIDVVLPGVSGLVLAAVAANTNTPALMMSGHPDAAENCESFGFLYLTKPFGIETLCRKTAKVLEGTCEAIRRTQEAAARMQEARKRLNDEIALGKRLVIEGRMLVTKAASIIPALPTVDREDQPVHKA